MERVAPLSMAEGGDFSFLLKDIRGESQSDLNPILKGFVQFWGAYH